MELYNTLARGTSMATSAQSTGDSLYENSSVLFAPSRHPEAGHQQGDRQLNIANVIKVVRRRRSTFGFAMITVAAMATGWAAYNRIFNPLFLGSFSFLISDPVRSSSPIATSLPSISAVARNYARNDVPTLIKVLESPLTLAPVYTALAEEGWDKKKPQIKVSLADKRKSDFKIAQGILTVEVYGSSPNLVMRALELTEESYLEWSLRQRREKLIGSVNFLDQQAPKLEARAADIQKQVEAFRKVNQVVQPVEEAEALRSQIDVLKADLLRSQAQRSQLKLTRRDVANGKLSARAFSSTSSTGENPQANVQITVPGGSLLEELTALEARIAAAQATYQPDNPILQGLIAARRTLRPKIQLKELAAIDAALSESDQHITSTQAKITELQARFARLPALLREYSNLQQRLNLAKSSLQSYLQTREQFQLEIAQNTVPWKVVRPASVLKNPVEPDLGRSLVEGVLLGAAAGVAASLLRDRLDHVFHSAAEVREDLGRPLLGHVPHIDFLADLRREKRFLLGELDQQTSGEGTYQRFLYQEAFRNLATSLRFLKADEPLRTLAVSSSVPSEGKSLVLVLLAKTLNELGQKVLIVDSDMRLPQIHTRLGVDNVTGLSNLLSDEMLRWQDAVQPVEGRPGWEVLTSGRKPPDPPRLLGSARMAELVKEIVSSRSYDLVLFDTPPALGLADASLVAEHLDGIILLVSLSRVDRSLPHEAIHRLKVAGAPLLGVVTNEREKRLELNNAYGYQSSKYERYGYSKYRYSYSHISDAGDPSTDPSLTYTYYNDSSRQASSRQGLNSALKQSSRSSQHLLDARIKLASFGRKIQRWIDRV